MKIIRLVYMYGWHYLWQTIRIECCSRNNGLVCVWVTLFVANYWNRIFSENNRLVYMWVAFFKMANQWIGIWQ